MGDVKGWLVYPKIQRRWIDTYLDWVYRARRVAWSHGLLDLAEALDEVMGLVHGMYLGNNFMIEVDDLVDVYNQTIDTLASHRLRWDKDNDRWTSDTYSPS